MDLDSTNESMLSEDERPAEKLTECLVNECLWLGRRKIRQIKQAV